MKSRRNQEQPSKGLSNCCHTRRPSFLPQRVVTTHVKRYPPGKPIRESEPVIFTGGSSCGSLCGACAEIPDSRRRAGVRQKHIVLYKQFRPSEPLLSVRVLGTLPRSQFPGASQGPTLSARPFTAAASGLLRRLSPAQTFKSSPCRSRLLTPLVAGTWRNNK